MNILVINHYAGSRFHGMELRSYYLAREWLRLGHQVTMVAASYSHLRYTQPSKHQMKIAEESIDGINYFWLKTPPYAGNNARIINIAVFFYRLSRHWRRVVGTLSPDLVIATSTYLLDNIIRIAKKYQAQHVYEVHDLWPLSLMELAGMSKWHPFILLMAWAEKYAYRQADVVVSLLPRAGTRT